MVLEKLLLAIYCFLSVESLILLGGGVTPWIFCGGVMLCSSNFNPVSNHNTLFCFMISKDSLVTFFLSFSMVQGDKWVFYTWSP